MLDGRSGAATGSARILVVDDQASARQVIADRLAEAGFEVVEAETLAEARLKMSDASPFAAVVVDIALRDGAGDTFARELRTACPASRIVVVTGYSESSLRQQLSDDPAVAVLGKPVNADALALTLLGLGVAPH